MSKFVCMKFEVDTPKQSAALQRYLFELGYYWSSAPKSKEPRRLNSRFLYTDNLGIITFDDSRQHFEAKSPPETYTVKYESQLVVEGLVKPLGEFIYNEGSDGMPPNLLGETIEVIYRHGGHREVEAGGSGAITFAHHGVPLDIIAYRLI